MLLSGKLKPATVTLPLLAGVLVLPVVAPQAAAAMANATKPASNHREPSLRFIEAPPWPGRDFRSNPAPGRILPSRAQAVLNVVARRPIGAFRIRIPRGTSTR